jgi:SAM-dependent methyltransferase
MRKGSYLFLLGLFAVVIGCLSGAFAQAPQDQEEVWRSFMAWFKATAVLESNPTRGYLLDLQKKGVPRPEIERQANIITGLFFNRPDAVEIYYDRLFARPVTGNPARDGFNSSPSALMVDAVKGAKPGTALDCGMGQGRNAVYLAQQGWNVTGFDISKEAVAAARSNAEKAGVAITAVKAGYHTFDFGEAKWDLIVLTFAWAPVAEPAFVEKLGTSLRPGGRIVFEHFLDTPERPYPPELKVPKPGQLRTIFAGFTIDSYEETEDTGDWGGPGSQLVRMIARKR